MKHFLSCVALAATVLCNSCGTGNPRVVPPIATADSVRVMSDHSVCYLLAPERITTSQEIEVLTQEAQRRGLTCRRSSASTAIEPNTGKQRSDSPKRDDIEVGSGTGFYISPEGYVLTNEHVVEQCSKVELRPIGRPPITARIIATDPQNDLAIVLSAERGHQVALFRSSPVRQGEEIAVYGFPLTGALSSSGNATVGYVTALTGMFDDTRMLQISAPVQAGNSGGPLLDKSGSIVGIVVSKLDAAKVYEIVGDIPQNVNFALKVNVAQIFLESHGIGYENSRNSKELSIPDVVDVARDISVRVLCYQ